MCSPASFLWCGNWSHSICVSSGWKVWAAAPLTRTSWGRAGPEALGRAGSSRWVSRPCRAAWAHSLCKVLHLQDFQMIKIFKNHQSPQIPNEIFRWEKKIQEAQVNGSPLWMIKQYIHFKPGFTVKKKKKKTTTPKCAWSIFSPTPVLVLPKWCLVAPLVYTYPSSCPYLGDTRPRKTQESAEHKIILCLQAPSYIALALGKHGGEHGL